MGYLLKLLFLVNILIGACNFYYEDINWLTEEQNDDLNDEIHESDLQLKLVTSAGYRPENRDIEMAVVSIRTERPTQFFGDNHFCAGTLVGFRMVITAAHCLVDSHYIETRPRRIVVVGATPNRLHRTRWSVEMAVKEIHVHPSYKRDRHHDIAILNLEKEIPFNNPFIRILNIMRERPQEGTKCTTIGWGQLLHMGPFVADNLFIDLEILNNSKCEMHYGRKIHESSICVGDWSPSQPGSCRGESGAPLICNNYFAAIVSWGKLCGNGPVPSVFTALDKHRMWFFSIAGAQDRNKSSLFLVGIMSWLSFRLKLISFD